MTMQVLCRERRVVESVIHLREYVRCPRAGGKFKTLTENVSAGKVPLTAWA